MKTTSERLGSELRALTPGGVHSNVRLSGPKAFIDRAKGAWLYDVDGKDYVDHLLGQGPNFLGHAPEPILDAVAEACRKGMVYGGQHPLEVEASRTALEAIGWADNIRFGLSGSEMVHAAIRLARAQTGRRKFIRFEGHYHGWFDNIIMGFDGENFGPASQGQSEVDLASQILLPWNDADAVTEAFAEHGHDIAAIITEPMMINSGSILARPGYLQHLREVTTDYDALLIFDEVISGFRLALGGAAERFSITPDLATYGKAIAGGFPVAALAGRADLMEPFGTGVVNHSGTFNSNVMGMAAVVASMSELTERPPYERINEYGSQLMRELPKLGAAHGLDLRVQGLPVAFNATFGNVEAHDARSAMDNDLARYARFADVLVEHGVWVAGRGIWYTSAAHTPDVLAAVLERAEAAMASFAQR